jgi:photosystem II stability/assembly factor-like uncharacterized protein
MSDDERFDELGRELRASLARHAADAPGGELLAERILAEAGRTDAGRTPAPPSRDPSGDPSRRPSRRRGRPTWTLPLVAADAVAGLVTAAVGLARVHPHRDSAPPPGVSGSAPVRPTPTPRATSPSPATSPSAVHRVDLRGVRVRDLTFVGPDDGWALGSADCMSGPGRCTALLRTTDGRSWPGMRGAAFNVPGVDHCADPCVSGLRFADDRIGYAFGPSALFMTSDGGAHWTRQPGLGASALETLDGNVLRYDRGTLARAAIGSTHWTPVALPGGTPSGTVTLARAEHVAVLLASRYDPAKGYDQPATLYRSGDDGHTWQRAGDPCPYLGTGYSDNAVGLTVGADGSIAVACVGRDEQQTFSGGEVITSVDGGRHFSRPAATGKLGRASLVAAADAQHQFVVALASGRPAETRTGMYASAGPLPWNPVADITGVVTFAGFESTTVGRVVADGGKTIWTTRDAGATWREVTLP